MDDRILVKETQCPICNQQININVKSEDISCNSCQKTFMYKFCPECNSIIYFNKIDYDGYNIQCPYISCRSISCSVKCIKCKKKIFFNSNYKYSQGDEVKCKECSHSFKKVKCPSLNCDKTFELEREFYEGNQLTCYHNGVPFQFQKLGCWYCGRHCVWDNSKGKIYIEGQEIQCPYKECTKITNKVTCPKCKTTSIIAKANLEMGKKISCLMKQCNNTYNICFCPYCKKSFYFVNCFYCKQINFWKDGKEYIPCQTVVCNNEYCKKKSALIQCPWCKKTNHFTKGYFILGKEFGCSYRECKKEFVILYCGNCNTTRIRSPNLTPENLYRCDLCQKYMPTVQCPKCFKFCSPKNSDIKLENCTLIKCPYSSCGEKFYYYLCPFCKHDFNSSILSSLNIKCPFTKCNKSYNYFKCINCNNENFKISEENKMDIESEEMICEYCKSNNNVSNTPDKNKTIEVKKANMVQGEKYIFDNPEEDPYDRRIINSLIKTKLYEIISKKIPNEDQESKEKKMCVVCLNNPIEWILVPCGHKCLCPDCGQMYKIDPNQNNPNQNEQKKCPICKENIIGILEKVIDD